MLTIAAILMALGLSKAHSHSNSFPASVISCLLVFVAAILCSVDLYFVLKKFTFIFIPYFQSIQLNDMHYLFSRPRPVTFTFDLGETWGCNKWFQGKPAHGNRQLYLERRCKKNHLVISTSARVLSCFYIYSALRLALIDGELFSITRYISNYWSLC